MIGVISGVLINILNDRLSKPDPLPEIVVENCSCNNDKAIDNHPLEERRLNQSSETTD